MVQSVGTGELEPGVRPALPPDLANLRGLFGFDVPWREERLAAGDIGPDERARGSRAPSHRAPCRTALAHAGWSRAVPPGRSARGDAASRGTARQSTAPTGLLSHISENPTARRGAPRARGRSGRKPGRRCRISWRRACAVGARPARVRRATGRVRHTGSVGAVAGACAGRARSPRFGAARSGRGHVRRQADEPVRARRGCRAQQGEETGRRRSFAGALRTSRSLCGGHGREG